MNQASVGLPIESNSDWDNDGLDNKDESYWNTDPNNPDTDNDGYLDGEEVASNHDPLKPSPNDKLPTLENLNITDKISTLMAAGYYAGDLSADTDPAVYNKAMANISIEMLADGTQALSPENLPAEKITLSSDSKKDQEEYLNAVGTIIQVDLWGKMVNEPRTVVGLFTSFYSGDPQAVAGNKDYFNSTAAYYKEVVGKINAVPVPSSWLDIHREIVSDLQTLAINHKALSQTSEDPLKSIMAMNNLMSVYKSVQPTLVTITQRIKKNNLNPPNGQLWSLVNSLTDGF